MKMEGNPKSQNGEELPSLPSGIISYGNGFQTRGNSWWENKVTTHLPMRDLPLPVDGNLGLPQEVPNIPLNIRCSLFEMSWTLGLLG